MTKLKRHELAKLIGDHLAGDKKFTPEQIAAYLMETGRERELDSLMRDVMSLRADDGQVELTVTSAHPLDRDAIARIEQLVKQIRPEAKTVIVDEQIKPTLIGGLKLNMVHHELDLSLLGRLNQLKRKLNAKGAN